MNGEIYELSNSLNNTQNTINRFLTLTHNISKEEDLEVKRANSKAEVNKSEAKAKLAREIAETSERIEFEKLRAWDELKNNSRWDNDLGSFENSDW